MDATDNRTTDQDIVDTAVDRRGAAWVRENVERVLEPLKTIGIDADPEDVTIPAVGGNEGDTDP